MDKSNQAFNFLGFRIFDEGKRQLTIDNGLAAKIKVMFLGNWRIPCIVCSSAHYLLTK